MAMKTEKWQSKYDLQWQALPNKSTADSCMVMGAPKPPRDCKQRRKAWFSA